MSVDRSNVNSPQIDFIKAFETQSLDVFMDEVFPPHWKPVAARVLESGAEFGDVNKFAPKWSKIPYTVRTGDSKLETAMKSTIFRVHDCLHQLWGLPVPNAYDEDNRQRFKRAWMCSEVATLTLTEFVYCEWLYNTQPHVKHLLEKRNTLLFKATTALSRKSAEQIAIRLDQLLHKRTKPSWVKDNEHARIFLEDFIPMLETDRVNIDYNWTLLQQHVPLEDLQHLPNQRYAHHLDGLELTEWMVRDFHHTMGTDDKVDKGLMHFNRNRRGTVTLPDTWSAPCETIAA